MTERARLSLAELPPGGLRAVRVDERDVLLARVGDEVYGLQARCPHAGAPLEQGVLSGTRLVCPWHHACFDVRSGALQEPPALSGVKRYQVRRLGEEVEVTLVEAPAPPRPLPRPDGRTLVILGGGAAGELCAQTLREEGFGGRVVLLSAEERPPYDRTLLSKKFLAGQAGPEDLPLRGADWYARHAVEWRPGTRVLGVDVSERRLLLDGGETLSYDGLLVATGSTPRRLSVPGADLAGVLTLRRPEDAERLIARARRGRSAVVVGSSFTGMEGAASLRARGLNVTVVGREKVPFAGVLGAEVGRFFQTLHEQQGVTFRLGTEVERFEGGAGQVEAVVLKGGERLPADLVLQGVGVRPATGALPPAILDEDGAVNVDATLRSPAGFYAAGDIARFPGVHSGTRLQVLHWRVAQQHGRLAARNLLGGHEPYQGVPFFWTQQFGRSLRYVGHAERWDDTVTWGDVPGGNFLVFYLQGQTVRAAAGVGRDTQLAAFEELLRLNRVPSAQELRAREFDLRGRL